MATDRNKPKKPRIKLLDSAGFDGKTIDLDPTQFGQGLEDRKRFWSAGRTTNRGKIFWFDIETTGLGKQVTEFGPERWNDIVEKLDGNTDLPNKLDKFKRLEEYKYFKDVGLAQFVTHSRHGPKASQGGLPPWSHGAGYTTWEDNFANLLKSKRYEVSEFSRRKGIVRRSLEAALTGDAKTEFSALSDFSKNLITNTAWGRSTLRGWNVWFDVFATQAFMARHAGALDAAGIDPFAMMKATKKGLLNIESMEEHYFDMLAWKGWQNPQWARENLRFGKMYAAKVGANPGDPIPIHEHVARKAEGKGSLLRGRYGWKAELLEGIFDQYGAVTSSLKGWKFPGGRHLGQLDAHDAMRDVASEYELSRRFVFTNRALEHYDARWNTIKHNFPGRSQEDIVGALAFARSGFLGKQFSSRGMKGSSYIRHMAQPHMIEGMLKRAGTIWGAIEAQSAPIHKPSGPHKRIRSPYGDYLRLVWDRNISNEAFQDVRTGSLKNMQLDIASKFTRAKNAWTGLHRAGKIGAIGAAAYILNNAFFKGQDTIDSNMPYDYIPGQQSHSKVIDVPWNSPWEGIASDDRSALDMLIKGGLVAGGVAAIYNSPGLVYKAMGQEGVDRMFFASRMLEDMVPFRVGRFANISSFWSSYMTPNQYDMPIKHLAHGDMALTAVGRRYAETLGVSHFDFLRAINMEKTRGRANLEHTRVGGNSPFMRIDLNDLGSFDVRMVESTSRLGNSFGGMGADSIQLRSVSPAQQIKRSHHILNEAIKPGEFGLARKAIRGLRKLFPETIESAVNRWAAIPQWDRNEFMDLQKIKDMASKPVFVPAYHKGDYYRATVGISRDYLMSGYGEVRQQAAVFGIHMSSGRSAGSMAKGLAGLGIKATAAIGAFGLLNNTLGGALTDPFFNVYERLMLARASVSDATGLTSLREQMPGIQTTAMLGVIGMPLAAGMLYKYGVRQRSLIKDYSTLLGDPSSYKNSIWGVDPEGYGVNIREESYRVAKARGSAGIKSMMYNADFLYGAEKVGANQFMKWKNLSKFGKGIVGTFGTMAALVSPFLLGSKHTREELEEIYGGNRNVEVNRGRWWELGATPYEGGRTHYFRRHQIARRKERAGEEIPGAGSTGIFGALRSLLNPYWREQEAMSDRPYPITGGTFLGEIPLIGPLADSTIGRWIKPPKLMHTAQWQSGDPYEQYGNRLASNPGMGGTGSPDPRDPSGLAAQIREATYRTTELAGLRGYLTQAIGFQGLFGGDMPFEQAAVMQPARLGPSITDSFWERDMGGMAGINEIFRRLYPRPERGTEVNPLRNNMPSWMPGDNYFINFQAGDPYSKVRYGGERLPGAGYESLNPEVEGMSPENYPAFHKYKILADVAPWSQQARSARGAAYADARNQPGRLEALDRIDREVEQVKKKKNFKEYSFLNNRDAINGTVSSISSSGEITLSDYPHHRFTMAGISMGSSAVADQIRRQSRMTKEAATQRAFEATGQRQALLEDLMLGANVRVAINEGGMNAPNVAGVFSMNGTNINKMLIDKGLAGNEGGIATASAFQTDLGRLVEGIGHLPQHIPGPWMSMTKFFNQADPIEQYRRDVLYGSNNRFWDSPYENFIRPYMHQTISKITPGEYIPTHIEEQREMDIYLDRTKFLKAAHSGQMGQTKRTMAGADMYGDPALIQSALPHRDKAFFESFRQETDPDSRKRILSMVSQDMQRALVGQWTKQYAATEGKSVSGSNNISQAVQMAQSQLRRMKRPVAEAGWAGNNPSVDWEDIKAVMVQHEGLDTHDFNIWDDRANSLLRKPYVYGAVANLTSRQMPVPITAMANDMSRNMKTQFLPVESINFNNTVSFTMNNNVNYAAWEDEQYRNNIDDERGF